MTPKQKHEIFLRNVGYVKSDEKYKNPLPDLSVSTRGVGELGNKIPGAIPKRTVDDYKWRKGPEEKPEVIAATERKKLQVAPICNKGAVMFITEESEINTLGRKV